MREREGGKWGKCVSLREEERRSRKYGKRERERKWERPRERERERTGNKRVRILK